MFAWYDLSSGTQRDGVKCGVVRDHKAEDKPFYNLSDSFENHSLLIV